MSEEKVARGNFEERLKIVEANLEVLRDAHSTNLSEIQRAFVLNDINVQILQRMVLDLSNGTGRASEYRAQYQQIVTSVDSEDVEGAVEAWVNGASVDMAIEQCQKGGLNSTLPPPGPAGESMYEEHYFGGNYGKNSNQ